MKVDATVFGPALATITASVLEEYGSDRNIASLRVEFFDDENDNIYVRDEKGYQHEIPFACPERVVFLPGLVAGSLPWFGPKDRVVQAEFSGYEVPVYDASPKQYLLSEVKEVLEAFVQKTLQDLEQEK